jgi:hypothetical protein
MFISKLKFALGMFGQFDLDIFETNGIVISFDLLSSGLDE